MIARLIAKSDKNSILRDIVCLQIHGSRRSRRVLRRVKRFVVRAAGLVC